MADANRRRPMRALGLLALSLLPAGAAAEICNAAINSVTPMSRFTFHGDGTVTDSRTDLRWQRCSVGYALDDNGTAADPADDRCVEAATTTFDWQGALQAAADLNGAGGFAGFTDWRVPSVKELASIVEYKCADPAVNTVVFPDTPPAVFWSSTVYNYLDNAAVLDFQSGRNATNFKDAEGFVSFVRLVRSP